MEMQLAITFFNLSQAEPWSKLNTNCIPNTAKRLPSTKQKELTIKSWTMVKNNDKHAHCRF